MTSLHYSSPLASDLADVLGDSEPLWRELDGARVLITGGTGFVGCWLLEAALWVRERFAIDLRVDVLARRPERLAEIAPHVAARRAVRVLRGDLRSSAFADDVSASHEAERYTHVIHAATETNVALDNPPPLAAFDASVTGTRNVLELCRRDAVMRFLLVSSGAVYGRSHALGRPLQETDPLACVRGDLAGAYALGKASAEFLAFAAGAESQMTSVAARCFAFVGAYQPFDSGFAVGNFIRDALEGRPILIKGDGTAMRSYMYGADMALWLWTMLARGQHGDIFNVGSDRAVSIEQLASHVAREVASAVDGEPSPVDIAGKPSGKPAELFVPDISRARERLGLHVATRLEDAIRRTANWATQAPRAATQRLLAQNASAYDSALTATH